MTNKLNDSDFSAKRSILLDFDGGQCEYRNAALGGGGISPNLAQRHCV